MCRVPITVLFYDQTSKGLISIADYGSEYGECIPATSDCVRNVWRGVSMETVRVRKTATTDFIHTFLRGVRLNTEPFTHIITQTTYATIHNKSDQNRTIFKTIYSLCTYNCAQ